MRKHVDHCDFSCYRKSITMDIDISFVIQYNHFVVVLLKVNCVILLRGFLGFFCFGFFLFFLNKTTKEISFKI